MMRRYGKYVLGMCTIVWVLATGSMAVAQSSLIGVAIYDVGDNIVFAANGLGLQGYILDHVDDYVGYYEDGSPKTILWVRPKLMCPDYTAFTGEPAPYPGAHCIQFPDGTYGWQ